MASRVLPSLRQFCRSRMSLPYLAVSEPFCASRVWTNITLPVAWTSSIHTGTSGLQWKTISRTPFRSTGSGSGLLSLPHTSQYLPKRCMSLPALTKKHIRERIMLNLQLFDKINPEKLTLDSHFHKDLGLDSLDHVEIIMAVEDEFGFEIPDMDAQRLLTPALCAQYVADKYDVFDEDEHHHGHDDHGHDHGHAAEDEDPWAKEKPKAAPAHH